MVINVLSYLEETTQRFPEKVAFIDVRNQITFGDLLKQSKSIGTTIAAISHGEIRKPYVVFVDRNIESLVAFLGVAYSGNFYVPIDIQMPKKRIELILDTLNPAGVIVTPGGEKLAKEFTGELSSIGFQKAQSTVADEKLLAGIRRKIIDNDPLYATFTSGSTGVPKGVLTSHRSVIDMTENLVKVFDFDESHIFGNQNPFYFDASIKDIYSALKVGATMYVLPKSYFMMQGDLIDYMIDNKIDTILWSAAAIALLANSKAFEDKKPHFLRKVMFSGEVMHNKVLNYWRNHLPNTLFVNLYGPTEITSVCTYYKIERSFDDDEVLPIGLPFENTEVLLLDENNQIVQGTEAFGEICVRGCSLALGYYNNQKKTAAVFCQNPTQSTYPDVIYRTGDLARYNDLGEIMFISRKDNQVKHMGQRVELGEVEIIMNALSKIDASVCFYDHDNQKIIAVFEGCNAERKYIYSHLRDSISKYMYPNVLIKLDKLPYNLNGKIDRSSLKRDYFEGKLNSFLI